MAFCAAVSALGARVVPAHILPVIPNLGATGVCWSTPVCRALAGGAGLLYYLVRQKRLFAWDRADFPQSV